MDIFSQKKLSQKKKKKKYFSIIALFVLFGEVGDEIYSYCYFLKLQVKYLLTIIIVSQIFIIVKIRIDSKLEQTNK